MGLFKAVRALWRWLALRPAPPPEPGGVALAPLIPRLTALARLIAGEALEIAPAGAAGGLRGRALLLPPRISASRDPAENEEIYTLRVIVAATARRGRLGRQPPGEDPAAVALQGLEVAAAAVALASEELPGFGARWAAASAVVLASRPAEGALRGRAALLEQATQRFLRGEPCALGEGLRGRLDAAPDRGPPAPPVPLWGPVYPDPAEAGAPAGGDGDEPRSPLHGSEAEAPPIEEVRRVTLDPRAQQEAVLQHSFEKVETLDEHRGQIRDDDGDDELEAHLEALQEVKLRDLMRGGAPAHSLLRAPVQLDADIPDVSRAAPGEGGLPYDEWDRRRGEYRRGWCTVYPAAPPPGEPGWAAAQRARNHRLIAELTERSLARRTRRSPERRRLDGDEVDLDALVDHRAAVLAGRSGDGRLYIRDTRHQRSVATTVLLDLSLSSDAWVADRRVLDVSCESAFVLGEVASRLGDDLRVLAFASHTRNHCRVWELKRWDEAWSTAAPRLGGLHPQGYTRIGPALRHAVAGFAARPADRKLLLLITDGKPTDHDRYEGRYGLADVRMALREAERAGVLAHALAIDPTARALLPVMMGVGAYTWLPTPGHLIRAMTEVFARMSSD